MIEYYSLIAMTCLYGAILSMYSINQCLPNMTSKGKRIAVSGISKTKLIISNLVGSFVVQLIGVFLLFSFMLFVLGVDFGSNLLLVILLTDWNSKMGIIIAITMLFSFLSGLMGITMKYIIDSNLPIINKINPVSMITDGFYSLYFYDTLDRLIFNIISLIIFSLILISISFVSLRRQKYDSI